MDIKAILNEFKDFAFKGNVIDLAVAVVIAKAFGDVVQAVVACFITPVISVFLRFLPGMVAGNLAALVTAVITFLAIAAVIFFGVVKPMGILARMAKKNADGTPAEPLPVPPDIALLTEIRDLLKTKPAA